MRLPCSKEDDPSPTRVVGSICDRRQAVSCARFCFITAEAGKAACIRWAVIGELLGPHAPRALLELSLSPTLDPGLGVCSRRTGSRQHRAGLPIVHASR